jgi:diguanylate cyclase (GGDEF)-like protein
MGATGAPPGKRGKVLVVDDSRVVRAVISTCLEAGGFEVAEAPDGASGLTLLGDCDVVITDLNMPGLDGFGLLAAVKARTPGVEVIILTGAHADDMGAAVKALRLGAHDYLVKPPANSDEVVLAVERALEKKHLRDTNERLLRQLEMLSLTDALTGVGNRRAFVVDVERELARSRRHKHPFGLALVDVDHFKKVNDTYGHQAGDEVLRCFVRLAAGALRKGDSLYRYGGEEFVILLPHAALGGAVLAAERVLAAVASSEIKLGEKGVRITASAGVAGVGATETVAEALSRADAALYEAKRGGRNRVCPAP